MVKQFGTLAGALVLVTAAQASAQPAPAAAPEAPPSGAGPAPVAPAAAAPAAAAAVPVAPVAPAAATTGVAAAPVAAADATPAPAPAPGAADAAPAAPSDKVAIAKGGKGFFQPSFLGQFWGFYSNNPNITQGDRNASSFRVRRAEIRIKGDIVPDLLAYNVMFDPSKAFTFGSKTVPVTGEQPAPTTAGSTSVLQPTYSDPAILQDFFITLKSKYADVSFGQFKIQLSYEGFNAAAKISLPERALVARQYGDKRDLGLKVEKKLGEYFFYSVGLYNGGAAASSRTATATASGQNVLDTDNEKDVALRLEVYPIKGLTLGGVGYTTVGERDGGYRDRIEGDLKFDAYDIFVLAEYIHAWDGPEATKFEGHGGYATLGYTLFQQFQPLVRFGFVNPNFNTQGDRVRHYEGAFNYYLQALEARFSASVSAFKPENTRASNLPRVKTRWEGILAAQVSF